MPIGMKYASLFSTSVHGIAIHLVTEDISRILHILSEEWDHLHGPHSHGIFYKSLLCFVYQVLA